MPESRLTQTDAGLVPEGDGWFVVNARDARWSHHRTFGSCVTFEGEAPRFAQLGINLNVLRPGELMCMYHGENAQEDFLDGEERTLGKWDFVHCPPWVEHVFVGAGDGPCIVLAVGARPEGFGAAEAIKYPPNDAARKHGAAVEVETPNPREAYAPYGRADPGPYRDGDLP